MTDIIIKLFRLEKPLYRWCERPSPNAFVMNFERSHRPKKFWNRIVRLIYLWSSVVAILITFFVILVFLVRRPTVINLIELSFGVLAAFSVFSAAFAGLHFASLFSDRTIVLFDKVIATEGVSWKYQDLEFFAFTQMIYQNSNARYPCIVLVNRDQRRTIIGIPNPEVSLCVTEIFSSRVTLRTDYKEIMFEDAKTQLDL